MTAYGLVLNDGRRGGETSPAILPTLLRGAVAVCHICRTEIPAGDARIGVRAAPGSSVTVWRCGDCEYRLARV